MTVDNDTVPIGAHFERLDRAAAPLSSSFSRGRSPQGQSRIAIIQLRPRGAEGTRKFSASKQIRLGIRYHELVRIQSVPFLSFAAGALIGLLLAGCGPSNVRTDYHLDQHPGDGVVVLSVTHDLDAGRAATAKFYLDGTSSLLDPDTKVLSSLNEVMGVKTGSDYEDAYGQIYVIPLAAGRHRIASWQITNALGAGRLPDGPLAPLVFDVVAGQVTYIGNLNARLSAARNFLGAHVINDAAVEVRDRRETDLPLLEERYPQLKGKAVIALLPLGAWGGDDTMKGLQPADAPPLSR
jgi:hypothetical protein